MLQQRDTYKNAFAAKDRAVNSACHAGKEGGL